MSAEQSNHREPEPVTLPTDTSHARTPSVLLTAHRHASHGSAAHSMEYGTAATPTSLDADGHSPTCISPVSPSMEDIREQHHSIIRRAMEPNGTQYVRCFNKYVDQPPITPESLAELDMPRIINNPKLRHDVNFDRELHFRPNLDGSKGRQKMLQAEEYWKALEAEFCVYHESQIQKTKDGNDEYWNRVAKDALVRLPKVLTSIRDILKTLVPDYDQKVITERLDVDHIMQQIIMGMCDLIDLGNWFAKILKNHCAPMRDCLVDAMQKEIRIGVTEGKHHKLVGGLRQLMTILEAMKLDVANHQIRHMRPLLIDDTINFQRRYNAHRIGIKKIDAEENRLWLQDATEELRLQENSPMEALASALLHDVLFKDPTSICPPSFYLDTDRLRSLRTELHSIIYHAICRDILRDIALPRVGEVGMLRAYEMLYVSVAAIVGSHGKFVDRLENIAVEIVRVTLVVEGQASEPFDPNLLKLTQQMLIDSLRPDSRAFGIGAQQLHDRLVPKIQSRSNRCVRMNAMTLQDTFVPNASPTRTSTSGFGAVLDPFSALSAELDDVDDDFVRRFAHIVVLHWQVWADLVYLLPAPEPDHAADKDDDVSSDSSSDAATVIVPSVANSPTVAVAQPVAHAVFPPGRKWLPTGIAMTDELPEQTSSPPASEVGAPASSSSEASEEQHSSSSSSIGSQSRQPAI